MLTFQQFIDNIVTVFNIPESLVFVKKPYQHGWHFSDNVNYVDFQCSWYMPEGEMSIVGGGIISYLHREGYHIDCKGLADELTLNEVRELFGKTIPGKGTYIGTFKLPFKEWKAENFYDAGEGYYLSNNPDDFKYYKEKELKEIFFLK